MRVLVINPVGTEEWNESDRLIYQAFASDNTEVDIVSLERGPRSIENRVAEAEVIPLIIQKALEHYKKYDGIIVNCCLDPGIDVLRSLIPIPTVGPCQASLALASVLGRKIGIVTVSRSAVPIFEELVVKYRMENRVVSIRGIPISVPEILEDENRTVRLLKGEIEKAVENGADVVVLGCTGLAGFAKKVQEFFEVPILDPAAAAVKVIEDIVEIRRESHG